MASSDDRLLDRCFDSPPTALKPLFDKAFASSKTRFSGVIWFYAPNIVQFRSSFQEAANPYHFPGISVTGRSCELRCEHCRGRLLESMIPVSTPQEFLEVCKRIHERGGVGCLVSGGSLRNGSVPLLKFIPAIKRAKREMGLSMVVHCGLVQPALAEALSDVGIDAALIDVIGSDETISDVFHLDCGVSAFDRSLTLLEEHAIPVVPHIITGIHYGRMKGERKAVEIVSAHRPEAVVVVALMPLEGTPMEGVGAVPPVDIGRVILALRLSMPQTPTILGCARPRGRHRSLTDAVAIRAGVSGIAYPSEEAYALARRLGLTVRLSGECCALLWKDVSSFSRCGGDGR